MTSDPPTSPPSVGERLLKAYARGFPVQKGKLRAVDSFWRLASANDDPMRWATLRDGGFRIRCDLRETLQRQFYFFGTYFVENTNLATWSRMAREADTVFDVGANLGIYSLAALAANPSARVHAFEPTPEIAERLRQTATLNGLSTLTVHEAAVFSREGYVSLRRFGRSEGGNEGTNFVVSDLDARQGEAVRAVTLDGVCDELGLERIDMLKLDVQGHEATVLQGAQKLLAKRGIRLMFLELNWTDEPDGPASNVINMLEQYGYVFATIGPTQTWRPAGDWMRNLSDVIARAPDADSRS